MGQTQNKGYHNQGLYKQGQLIASAAMSCQTDDDCKHLDSYNSTPDNLVYMCPQAQCNSGKCNCGSSCKFDSYSGSCCQDLQQIGDISFCVNATKAPSSKIPEPIMSGEPVNDGTPAQVSK